MRVICCGQRGIVSSAVSSETSVALKQRLDARRHVVSTQTSVCAPMMSKSFTSSAARCVIREVSWNESCVRLSMTVFPA